VVSSVLVLSPKLRTSLYRLSAIALVALAAFGAVPRSTTAQAAFPDWSPGPHAVGDETYDGFIDYPVSGATVPGDSPLGIGGWVVDRTADGWSGIDDVHIYEGTAGAGGTFLGQALVAQSRPDVAAALNNPYWASSGFWATVPAGSLAPGMRTLTVYAHTPGKGWWSKEVTVNVTPGTSPTSPAPAPALRYPDDPLVVVLAPSSGEGITTPRDYQIRGYALDRNADASQGTGVDRIQIYMDGPRTAHDAVFLGDATLQQYHGSGGDFGSQFVRAGWDLTFRPTAFASTDHTLYIYVRSSASGKEILVTVPFKVVG
jgi:hypothetical protein